MRIVLMRIMLVLLLASVGSAEVLDRVAITIGTQVITQSEINEELRMSAFLNNEPPQWTGKAKRDAADRLIEQKLVLHEMELGRYAGGSPTEADAMLEKLEKTRSKSQGDFDRALKAAGITKQQLQEHLIWGLRLSTFVDLRFRPAVQVSRQDVEQYYAEKVLPDTATGKKPDLSKMRQQIRQTLSADRADRQMDEWLKDARTRAHIEIHKAAFEDGE
jgi:hypothetical protein